MSVLTVVRGENNYADSQQANSSLDTQRSRLSNAMFGELSFPTEQRQPSSCTETG